MNLPREWELLVAGVKMEPTSRNRQHIEKEFTGSGLDWNRVVDLAYQHDIAPLLYRSVRQLSGTPSAPAAIERLREAYLANALRNTLLFRELQKILTVLRDRRKPVVALKGASLAETVYRDRALRPMSDMDLLIRKEDIGEVEELLSGLGYGLDEEHSSRKDWCIAHYYQLAFRKEVSPAFTSCLEIHWMLERPTRPFRIDVDGLWERVTATEIAGVPALVLCPEDQLLHLCLHTCKHQLTAGFRSFCDIAEVVRQFGGQIDWEQVSVRASEWRINQYVYVALWLSEQFLGAQVPEQVMKALMPGGFDERLLQAAAERAIEERRGAQVFPSLLRLRYGGSPGDRTSILRVLFSRAVIAGRYNVSPESKAIYFYYPKRFKDLVTTYGADLWRFLRLGRRAVTKAEDGSKLSEWLALFRVDEAEADTSYSPPREEGGPRHQEKAAKPL